MVKLNNPEYRLWIPPSNKTEDRATPPHVARASASGIPAAAGPIPNPKLTCTPQEILSSLPIDVNDSNTTWYFPGQLLLRPATSVQQSDPWAFFAEYYCKAVNSSATSRGDGPRAEVDLQSRIQSMIDSMHENWRMSEVHTAMLLSPEDSEQMNEHHGELCKFQSNLAVVAVPDHFMNIVHHEIKRGWARQVELIKMIRESKDDESKVRAEVKASKYQTRWMSKDATQVQASNSRPTSDLSRSSYTPPATMRGTSSLSGPVTSHTSTQTASSPRPSGEYSRSGPDYQAHPSHVSSATPAPAGSAPSPSSAPSTSATTTKSNSTGPTMPDFVFRPNLARLFMRIVNKPPASGPSPTGSAEAGSLRLRGPVYLVIEIKFVLPSNTSSKRPEVPSDIFALHLKAGVYQVMLYLHIANVVWGTRLAMAHINDTFVRVAIDEDGKFATEILRGGFEDEIKSHSSTSWANIHNNLFVASTSTPTSTAETRPPIPSSSAPAEQPSSTTVDVLDSWAHFWKASSHLRLVDPDGNNDLLAMSIWQKMAYLGLFFSATHAYTTRTSETEADQDGYTRVASDPVLGQAMSSVLLPLSDELQSRLRFANNTKLAFEIYNKKEYFDKERHQISWRSRSVSPRKPVATPRTLTPTYPAASSTPGEDTPVARPTDRPQRTSDRRKPSDDRVPMGSGSTRSSRRMFTDHTRTSTGENSTPTPRASHAPNKRIRIANPSSPTPNPPHSISAPHLPLTSSPIGPTTSGMTTRSKGKATSDQSGSLPAAHASANPSVTAMDTEARSVRLRKRDLQEGCKAATSAGHKRKPDDDEGTGQEDGSFSTGPFLGAGGTGQTGNGGSASAGAKGGGSKTTQSAGAGRTTGSGCGNGTSHDVAIFGESRNPSSPMSKEARRTSPRLVTIDRDQPADNTSESGSETTTSSNSKSGPIQAEEDESRLEALRKLTLALGKLRNCGREIRVVSVESMDSIVDSIAAQRSNDLITDRGERCVGESDRIVDQSKMINTPESAIYNDPKQDDDTSPKEGPGLSVEILDHLVYRSSNPDRARRLGRSKKTDPVKRVPSQEDRQRKRIVSHASVASTNSTIGSASDLSSLSSIQVQLLSHRPAGVI